MDVDHSVAPVEFLHHRTVSRIAEPGVSIARKKTDAVGLERVVGVSDFLQCGVNVGQGHGGEEAEPVRVILHQLRCVFVACPGDASCDRLVAEPQARIRDGNHRSSDASSIHVLDRFRRSPGCVRCLQERPSLDLGHPYLWSEMMMDVDAVGLGRSSPLSESRRTVTRTRRCQAQRSEGRGQEGSSIKVGHNHLMTEM